MTRRDDAFALVFLALIVLLALLLRGLDAPIDFDEHYHLATIEQIREQFPAVQMDKTSAATSPLYHFMAAGIAGLIRGNPAAARILSAGMAIGAMWGLYWLARRRLQSTRALWMATVVALHPAILWFSSMAMTEVPSLFWAILALVAVTELRPPWLAGLSAGICLGAAVWTRQTWVFLSAVFLIVAWRRRLSVRDCLRDPMTVAGLMALLSAGALFAMWGGFYPPQEYASSHDLALNFGQPLFGLAMIGFYMPFAALSGRMPPKVIAGAAAVTVLVAIPPAGMVRLYAAGESLANPQGALQNVLNIIASKIGHLPASAVCVALIALGALAIFRWVHAAAGNRAIAFAMLCLAGLTVELLLVPQVWERYWSPAVPMMLLVGIVTMERSGRSRKAIRLQYAYLMSIGLAYFVWQLRT
jgi:4-amino-4-deoxy-L-arabinose transferase-like glycosyltransferase